MWLLAIQLAAGMVVARCYLKVRHPGARRPYTPVSPRASRRRTGLRSSASPLPCRSRRRSRCWASGLLVWDFPGADSRAESDPASSVETIFYGGQVVDIEA